MFSISSFTKALKQNLFLFNKNLFNRMVALHDYNIDHSKGTKSVTSARPKFWGIPVPMIVANKVDCPNEISDRREGGGQEVPGWFPECTNTFAVPSRRFPRPVPPYPPVPPYLLQPWVCIIMCFCFFL